MVSAEQRLRVVAAAVADAYERLGYQRTEGDHPGPTSDFFIIGKDSGPTLVIGLYATLSEPPGDVALVGSQSIDDREVDLYKLVETTGPWVVCDDVGISIQGPNGSDDSIEIVRELIADLDCS